MDSFHHLIVCPNTLETDKIPEHRRVSILFASVEPITRVRFISQDAAENDVPFVARPDIAKIQANLPFRHHISFESGRTIKDWLNGKEEGELIAQVFHESGAYNLIKIPLRKYRHRELKDRKFERFAGTLACPYCRLTLSRSDRTFSCPSCGKVFPYNGNAVDFLTSDLRSEFGITDTTNVSDHGYDARISDAIASNPDKLYIDVGAGFKYLGYENVVNFEIVDYPSTDVLGVGERLPFANDSFDGVFSAVVLEHVKDPFACAREMSRILKPGGELLCAAPFLQPRHGYPNHYYNMTREGLVNLFPDLQVVESDVPNYLHPMAAITWILSGYFQGLPAELQQDFLDAKVGDLLRLFPTGKSLDHPLFARLSPEMREALACGNFIRAIKPIQK